MPLVELAKVSLMVFGMILAFRAVTLVGANPAASESTISLKSDPTTATITTITTPSSSSSSSIKGSPACNGDCFPSQVLILVIFYHCLLVLFSTTSGDNDDLDKASGEEHEEEEEEDAATGSWTVELKWIMIKCKHACFWGIVVPLGYFLCVLIIDQRVDYSCHCKFPLWKNLLFALMVFMLVQFLFCFGSCFVKAIGQVQERTRGIITIDNNLQSQEDMLVASTEAESTKNPRRLKNTKRTVMNFVGYDSITEGEQVAGMRDSNDNDYEKGGGAYYTESNHNICRGTGKELAATETDPLLPVFTTASE